MVQYGIVEATARSFAVEGLRARAVWLLGPRELLVADDEGELLHLDVSLPRQDAQLSSVLVSPTAERVPLQAVRVVGSLNGDLRGLKGEPCGTLAAEDVHCAVLSREPRGAPARYCEPGYKHWD